MQRGGGYGGGGGSRGGEYGGERGGGYGGGGGGANHSPSFSQPHSESNGSEYGGHNSSNSNAGAAAAGAGYANKNQSPSHPNAAPAAAGAGYANKNQSSTPNAGAAAAGADYANKNQSPNHPNAAPAAAGAGYANRNNPSSNYSNAGAAAAGAGYANRNNSSSNYSNAGAAAAGAGYANRNNQSGNYSNAGAAAAGATYANNNNGSNAYGMGGGSWNGNYGNGSMGSYGGMGTASPSYGYGSSPYMNPYAGGGGGAGQAQAANAPANNAQGNPSSYDYSQPVNTAAAIPDAAPGIDPTTTPAARALQAFQTGDYPNAVLLTQQSLAQTPNDVNLHQFLALGMFAQGNYEQAAAPLYAVLAVGPGWNWTTLIGHYTDAGAYTTQLRNLEAFVKANPRSAQAQFVLAYEYISQGYQDAAIRPLKAVVALQPNDTISAQLLDKLQPPDAASIAVQPLDASKLPGVWIAQAPQNGTFTLTIPDATNFTWAFAAPGKPAVTIQGTYVVNNSVLTLSGVTPPGAPLAGQVALADDNHLSFKALNTPTGKPGLQFVR